MNIASETIQFRYFYWEAISEHFLYTSRQISYPNKCIYTLKVKGLTFKMSLILFWMWKWFGSANGTFSVGVWFCI